MPYTARVVEVMIASPGDLGAERQVIRELLHEWNAIYARERKLVVLPVGWETHASPRLGDRPQEVINEQILHSCDLLVGVFWTRLGTPTGEAASGTVEEIEKHVTAGKPAMLYSSNAPVHPDSVDAARGDGHVIVEAASRDRTAGEAGFLIDRGCKGEVFTVTDAGYQFVDTLAVQSDAI